MRNCFHIRVNKNSGYFCSFRYLSICISFVFALAILSSCNQEDCSLLADQAILSFQEYEEAVINGDNAVLVEEKCLAAKASLEFYYNNCEAENTTLEEALNSLPCQ